MIYEIPRPFAPPSGLPAISPSRGEIEQPHRRRQPISPLEGEMAGRPEGGSAGRRPRHEGTP
jgi:hypothetical protein